MELAAPPFRRVSTTDYVLGALREAIRDGRIGQGEQLREDSIAQALGTGRGSVREAIRQLVQEGLAEHRLHRGAFVRELSALDRADIYLAREAIEVFAAQRIIGADVPPDLSALESKLDDLRDSEDPMARPSARVIEADIGFHTELVRAAASPRLSRVYATLATETRMALQGHPPYPPDQYVDDHVRLLTALRERDSAAPALVRDHLRLSASLLTGRE
jgi:DNA-binding GntR family transcriptional regulator